jgi:bifunctional non-homologous end joining protein LigD
VRASQRGPLRFYVQKHEASHLHYDLRLEFGGALKSWAVPKGPSLSPLERRLAMLVEDHPLEYGSFEGVIPKGNYGAGTVMVWDEGTYEERHSATTKAAEAAMKEGLAKGHLSFILNGRKLKGEFSLIRFKNDARSWLLVKKRDGYSHFKRFDRFDERSVKTGRDLREIAALARRRAPAKRLEEPALTHLDKIYFPKDKITKGDLIDYYKSIAPVILPYLKDRPHSLHRHPNGIAAAGFYQKDLTGHLPRWLQTERIFSESADKTVNYLLCQDERSLLYMANLGCIEINPWFSRVGHLDDPDFFAIDLDPDGNPFDHVMDIAREFHGILRSVGFAHFCKTSGATGLHIGVPVGARYDFDEVRAFAEDICRLVAKKYPATTSVERSPARRKKKIYLDFLQNRRGQTLAAPFCVRPRAGAPVSMPLPWKGLAPGLKPGDFTLKNAPRLARKHDIFWRGVLGEAVNLEEGRRMLRKKYKID